MHEADNPLEHGYDVRCPRCDAFLRVDDSEDFDGNRYMEREQDFWMVCPRCEQDIRVHVTWEPTYTEWGCL